MGYAFKFLKPHHDYYERWTELRKRRKKVLIAFALSLPVVFPFGVLGELIFRTATLGFVAFILHAAWMQYLGWQVFSWPCPRCGCWFHCKSWISSWWASKCMHCDLPKYAPCNPDEQQVERIIGSA